jgi:hypothetical protein
MITSAVTTALSGDAINAAVRRASLKSEVLANKACAFGAAELDAMSVETLDKYAASIRPVDYSGAAGFHAAAHRGAETEIEEPFGGGALSRIKAAAAKAQ